MTVHICTVPYTPQLRQWMDRRGHYLKNAPPGALFAVGVYRSAPGLFSGFTQPVGPLRGLCVIGHPVARMLPQDGATGEVTRLYLEPGLPHGTASAVLRYAGSVAGWRGMHSLIAYHDRSIHTGCVYRKSGFKKDGTTSGGSWGTRPGRQSAALPSSSKRRWRLHVGRDR